MFENVWFKQSRRQRKHFLTERNKAALPQTAKARIVFHLVGDQQCEDVPSSYLLGLPPFLLLRRNSGEVYAPALEKKQILIEILKA